MTWLDELAELERKATKAPWCTDYRGDGSGTVRKGVEGDTDLDDSLLDDSRCPYIRGEVIYEDGVLASLLRNRAAQLIEIARAAEEVVDQESTIDESDEMKRLRAALEGK